MIGAIYFLPIFLIFNFKHFIAVQPTGELIMAMLQLAVFASTLAYVLYITVIKEIGVIKANVFTNLIPVFTGVFSFFILDEKFTTLKIAGMFLVMCGVVVSQSRIVARIIDGNSEKRNNADKILSKRGEIVQLNNQK